MVQYLIKFRTLTVLDVSDHRVRYYKEACAYEFVVYTEVPKANHCIVSTVHKAADSKSL